MTGSLNDARCQHTAILLSNGQVLVAGGYYGTNDETNHGTLFSAELYDPSSGIWTSTGSLTAPRGQHTATLLRNGQVLVAGGWSGSALYDSAELYDPVAGTWTNTGPLIGAHFDHTATLLADGRVLVAGGGSDRGIL